MEKNESYPVDETTIPVSGTNILSDEYIILSEIDEGTYLYPDRSEEDGALTETTVLIEIEGDEDDEFWLMEYDMTTKSIKFIGDENEEVIITLCGIQE